MSSNAAGDLERACSQQHGPWEGTSHLHWKTGPATMHVRRARDPRSGERARRARARPNRGTGSDCTHLRLCEDAEFLTRRQLARNTPGDKMRASLWVPRCVGAIRDPQGDAGWHRAGVRTKLPDHEAQQVFPTRRRTVRILQQTTSKPSQLSGATRNPVGISGLAQRMSCTGGA
mmetsp:Transcript_45189/g.118620  ORF Transcript_45189/g.118620 Transcript_45189/m.118620 type:complete len:174 (+) Transcript_45189:2318-2839(+)